MTTIPTIPVDLLGRVLDVIEALGWAPGWYYDREQAAAGVDPGRCAVNIGGALNTILFGQPLWPVAPDPVRYELRVAALALLSGGLAVANWEVVPGRTEVEVLDLLREVIAEAGGAS